MEEEEHEVYGGEIPEVGEMEAPDPDIDMSAADDDAVKVCFFFFFFVSLDLICRWRRWRKRLLRYASCRQRSKKRWELFKQFKQEKTFSLCCKFGADVNAESIELLLKEVSGKDITELIASGRQKLASVPSGGGVAVAASSPSSGGGASSAPAAAEKKEAKKEEKEESDDDMGFSLFE